MSQPLNLGDKIWMHYGPSVLIVGHLIDHSPDYKMLGVSPMPFDDYKKMTITERASCPINWCDAVACHYLCHVPYEELQKHDDLLKSKGAGFGFSPQ